MTRLGIDLNEVVRNYLNQFEYVYNKYKPNGIEINIEEEPPTTYDLANYFPFSGGTTEMLKFLYEESALEVFGHAGEMRRNIMNALNTYYMELNDYSEHKMMIVSREAARSIPATYFFLSKTGCMIGDVHFVTKYANEWDEVDILVTACPRVLDCKPKDKIAIKIKAPYNLASKADYEYDTIFDFIADKKVQNKLLELNKPTQNENNGLSKNWWGKVLHKFKSIRNRNKH